MKRVLTGFVAVVALLFVTSVQAGEFGTTDEAKALAEAAHKFYKEKGFDAISEKVYKQDPQFKNKDLYVFISDFKGVNVAHGAVPAFKGRNFFNLKDVEGKFLIQELINVAKTKGKGWVDYKWPNPKTKKIREKTTYAIKIDENHLLAVGAYKN